VALIGQRKEMAMAVRNNRTENRFSGLLAKLKAPASASNSEVSDLRQSRRLVNCEPLKAD